MNYELGDFVDNLTPKTQLDCRALCNPIQSATHKNSTNPNDPGFCTENIQNLSDVYEFAC